MQLREGQAGAGTPATDPNRRAPAEAGWQVMGFTTPQDDDPPQVRLVVRQALYLEELVKHPDRPNADIIRAVDALGRALVRLKEYLRETSP